jgi:hypothetical protein
MKPKPPISPDFERFRNFVGGYRLQSYEQRDSGLQFVGFLD